MNKEKYKMFFLGVLMLPVILGVLLNIISWITPEVIKFPTVMEIYSDFFQSLTEAKVLNAIKTTAIQVLISSAFSIVFGVIISFILNLNQWVWAIFEPTIDFLRSIPITFFIPAFALILGISSPNIVWILAVIPSTLIIFVNVSQGIKRQNVNRIHHYRLISRNKSRMSIFRKVTYFEILPYFISGFKIALSYAIVIVTVLEYMQMGDKIGLGTLVYNEMEQLNYKRVYSTITIVGLIGYVLNLLIDKVGNKYEV